MNSRLLVLSVCACLVVAGGFYLYLKDWERWDQEAQRGALLLARKQLFSLADARPNEEYKVKQFCELTAAGLGGPLGENDSAKQVVNNCRIAEFLK